MAARWSVMISTGSVKPFSLAPPSLTKRALSMTAWTAGLAVPVNCASASVSRAMMMPTPYSLQKFLEARGHVHGLADRAEIHLLLPTVVPHEGQPRRDRDLEVQLVAGLVRQFGVGLEDLDRGRDGPGGVVRLFAHRVPERDDGVAVELVQAGVVPVQDLLHVREFAVERLHDGGGLIAPGVAELDEAAQVREQHRDGAFLAFHDLVALEGGGYDLGGQVAPEGDAQVGERKVSLHGQRHRAEQPERADEEKRVAEREPQLKRLDRRRLDADEGQRQPGDRPDDAREGHDAGGEHRRAFGRQPDDPARQGEEQQQAQRGHHGARGRARACVRQPRRVRGRRALDRCSLEEDAGHEVPVAEIDVGVRAGTDRGRGGERPGS